jgi:hypothetical protein
MAAAALRHSTASLALLSQGMTTRSYLMLDASLYDRTVHVLVLNSAAQQQQ